MPRTEEPLQFSIPKDVILQRIEQIKESIHDAVIAIHELGFEDKESIEKYQEIQKIIFELRDSQNKLQAVLNQYDDIKLDELEDMSSYGACFIDPRLLSDKKYLYEKLEQSKLGIKELQKLQAQLLANKYKSKSESMFTNQNNTLKSVNGHEFRCVGERNKKPYYSQSTLPFMREIKAPIGQPSESALRIKQILQEKELELEKIASEITLLKMRKQGDFLTQDDVDEREAFHRNVTEKLLEIQSNGEKIYELGKHSTRSSSSLQCLQETPQSFSERNNLYQNLSGSQNNDVHFLKSSANKGDIDLSPQRQQKKTFDEFSRYPNGRTFKSHRQLFPEIRSPIERLNTSSKPSGVESLRIPSVLSSESEEDEDIRRLALKSQIFKNTELLKEVESCLNILNDSTNIVHSTDHIFGSQRSQSSHLDSSLGFARNRNESSEYERRGGRSNTDERERPFELWPSFSSLSNPRIPEPIDNIHSNQPVGSRPLKSEDNRKNISKFLLDKFMSDTSSRLEVFDMTLKFILDQQKKTLEEIFLLFGQMHNRMERNERLLTEIKEYITRQRKNENLLASSGRGFTTNLNNRICSENNIPQPKIFNPTVLYGQQQSSNCAYSQPFVPVRELWQGQPQSQNLGYLPNYASDQSGLMSNNSFIDLSYMDSPNQQQRGGSYPNQENILQPGIQLSNNPSSANIHRNDSPTGFQRASQSTNSMLNNQVPPGTRANNYWDNFRSYSRQNMLSSPKSHETQGRIAALEENGFGVFNRFDQTPARGSNGNKTFWSNNTFVDNVATKNRNREQKPQMTMQYRSTSSTSDNMPNVEAISQSSGILSQQNEDETLSGANSGHATNVSEIVRPLERSKIAQSLDDIEGNPSDQLSNLHLSSNFLDSEIFTNDLIDRIELESMNNSNNISAGAVTTEGQGNALSEISSKKDTVNDNSANNTSEGNNFVKTHTTYGNSASGEDEGIVNDCMDISVSSHSSPREPSRDLVINDNSEALYSQEAPQESNMNSQTHSPPRESSTLQSGGGVEKSAFARQRGSSGSLRFNESSSSFVPVRRPPEDNPMPSLLNNEPWNLMEPNLPYLEHGDEPQPDSKVKLETQEK